MEHKMLEVYGYDLLGIMIYQAQNVISGWNGNLDVFSFILSFQRCI